MSVTIDEIEVEIARRVTLLTTTPGTTDYAQGETATWSESDVPLTVELQASHIGHLGFVVSADDAPNSGQHRDEAGMFARLRTRTDVTFAYQLRPDCQRADSRLCARAARDLVKAVMAHWSAANVQLENAGRRVLSADGLWMLCTCSFIVHHDFPI